CYVSDATIAAELGISVSSVKRAVAELLAVGVIAADRGPGRGRATVYRTPIDRDAKGSAGATFSPSDRPSKGLTGATFSDEKRSHRRAQKVAPVSEKVAPVRAKGSAGAPPTSYEPQIEPPSEPGGTGGISDGGSISGEGSGGEPGPAPELPSGYFD